MIVSHPPRQDDEMSNNTHAQAGPSSVVPSRPVSLLGLGISKPKESQEHWDDDFLFQVSSTSPNHQNGSQNQRSRGKSPVPSFNEAGWMDTDVEDGPATGANTEDERASSGDEDDDEGEGGASGSARKRAKKDWQGFSMEGIVSQSSSSLPPSSSSPHHLLDSSTSSQPPRVPEPPLRQASFGSPSRTSSNSNLRPPLPSPGTSYESERSFVHPSRHSYAPQPFPSPTGNEFSSSPTQTHRSDSQSIAHLAGNTYSLQETYDDTPRSGRTRRRLRKRSRVGEEPLGDGSSEDDEGRDVACGGRDTADEGQKDSSMSSSPRQLIARGMSSIQKRLSYTSKPRLPSETPSPSRSPRKPEKTPSTEHTRPRRISIPLRYTPTNNQSDASPSTSNATPPLNGSPSGGSPYQRPASAVMGFHLPTRSNSGLSSPKIKPKPSSILMPPPPVPSVASRSRPTSVRQVTPLNHPSSSSNTNLNASSSTSTTAPGPSFPSEPFKLDKPKGIRRLSSLGRKSHRTASSVSSIPTKHSPTIAATPLPTLMASPRTSEVSTMPVAFESDLVRSSSTPSVRGVTRRNSLSDLRIPSRVASAQKALRERVGVVREFALKVEDLKSLQISYITLRESLVASFTSRASPPPPLLSQPSYSSSQPSFSIRRQSIDQFRSDQGAQALREIELQYSPWWEMAEVLVELGGGSLVDQETRDSNRLSEAGSSYSARERAVTLAGGLDVPMPSTPNGLNSSSTELSTSPLLAGVGPPQASPERWRASTGRSDLSRRQLEVLRTMLETPAPSTLPSLPSGLPPHSATATSTSRNRSYPHGACSSITLPSSSDYNQPSGSFPSSRTLVEDGSKSKSSSGRRVSRAGVKGIKDFLRSLRLGGDMPAGEGGEDVGMGDGKRSVSDPQRGNLLDDPVSLPSSGSEEGARRGIERGVVLAVAAAVELLEEEEEEEEEPNPKPP
ncbi:hypothetical protein BDY24DRAFT_371185 [Mrakia frigida]|uniref:uncharacterized protein n=1 Tax=Mrakia frigida TaxID=29902 RepID=UPI003FCC0924